MDIKDIDAMIMHPLFGYFLIGGIIALIALITAYFIYSDKKEEKKRTEKLKEIALRSGFSFGEAVDTDFSDLLSFSSYESKAWNMLKIEKQDIVWRIFDYRYGSGKSISLQTVFLAETSRSFPKFSLTRETLMLKMLKIIDLVGLKDIDFHSHPEFSKQYHLSGSDEPSIRSLFNENVIRHFETYKLEGSIVANMNKIAFYQLTKRLKPEEMPSRLEEVSKILSLFLR